MTAIALQAVIDFSLQLFGNTALFVVLAAIAVHHPTRRERPHDSPGRS